MTDSEKRHSNRRQIADRRQADAGVQKEEAGTPLPDAGAPQTAATCPKCGSIRTAVTAQVNEESHQLSLFRCETCGFRFTHLSSAES